MHTLLRVLNEGEEVTVDQVPEEEHPPVEVGFDICGSLEEPNYSANQGKPWSIQPVPCCLQILLSLESYNMCIK